MQLFNKLSKIINKYSYNCNYTKNKEISVLTHEQNDETLNKLLDEYKFMKIKTEVDDFDQSCIILFYKNISTLTQQTINFMNEYVNKNKTIIIIAALNFDFNLLIKSINANSIDAVNWSNEKLKNEYYIIIVNKD